MTPVATNDWEVIPDASDEVAYEALADDRVWNGFAIADLEPPFREFTRVATARQAGTSAGASCLIFKSPAFNTVVPSGDPSGVDAILTSVDLPQRTGVMVLPAHMASMNRRYDVPGGFQAMIRMAVDAHGFRSVSPLPGLIRLGPPDLSDLLELYAGYPENHFVPFQLEHGVFFGMRDEGRLVAAAGTLVASARYGIAALGGIYTMPEFRGRGYAGAVTSALVAELLDTGCRDVILNVVEANEPARRVYNRLGFREHCRYQTGEGLLRAV